VLEKAPEIIVMLALEIRWHSAQVLVPKFVSLNSEPENSGSFAPTQSIRRLPKPSELFI